MKPDGRAVVTVMDLGEAFRSIPSLRVAPSEFWTRSPMTMAFTVKDGVPRMCFETQDSSSMLFRHVDIDVGAYPLLACRWYIELPIHSPLDERTREGDNHRLGLFFGFITDRGEKRAMEVIWGNWLNNSDNTHIASISDFAYVRLERR